MDEAWLRQKYVIEGLSTYQIGKLVNRHPKRVYEWLKDLGIPTRKREWSTDPNPSLPYQNPEWLRREYLEKRRSAPEIGKDFGLTGETVSFWLKRFGIPRRDMSETRQAKHWGCAGESNPMYGRRGLLNPNWSGGQHERVNPNYYIWRKAVLERDHYFCRLCHSRENLEVHHIKKFGMYPDDRWNVDNGISLCHECHLKTRGHEDEHITEFALILSSSIRNPASNGL